MLSPLQSRCDTIAISAIHLWPLAADFLFPAQTGETRHTLGGDELAGLRVSVAADQYRKQRARIAGQRTVRQREGVPGLPRPATRSALRVDRANPPGDTPAAQAPQGTPSPYATTATARGTVFGWG